MQKLPPGCTAPRSDLPTAQTERTNSDHRAAVQIRRCQEHHCIPTRAAHAPPACADLLDSLGEVSALIYFGQLAAPYLAALALLGGGVTAYHMI